MTEEQIIQGCREGDRQAQHLLYARTCDRIFNLLLRITGDPEVAFDLAQDTYLKVYAHIGRFDGRSTLLTWLYRIAVNEARQFFRRRSLYASKLKDLTLQYNPLTTQDAKASSVMDIQEALARLPEFDRHLIVLRHFESLSYDELAEVLDCPAGTVASALNRARRRLRELLEPEITDHREDSVITDHL